MADNQKLTPVRGPGRPKVSSPRSYTLSIRLEASEYDAICRRASAAGIKEVSVIGRKAIRLFLFNE